MNHSNRNFNKTGLTFSISDVNFDSNSLDLVPIFLNSPVKENSNSVVDKKSDFHVTGITVSSDNHSTEDFVNSSIIKNEKENTNIFDSDLLVNDQRSFTNEVTSQQLFSNVCEVTPKNCPNNPPYVFRNNLNDNSCYEEISYYWFYCVIIDGLAEWKPFSVNDSNKIEMTYSEIVKNIENKYISIDDCVPTDGGRYDVFINKRQKLSVYWEEAPMEIRRASWFYRPEDESFYIPYSEIECEKLEMKFKYVLENNKWHQPFELGINNEQCLEDRFVFHSPNTMVEYRRYGYIPGSDNVMKGRVVYRGVEGFKNHLELGESDNVDHVIFVIHGIGSVCDMAGRGIIDCVKIMKSISKTMLKSHFPQHNGRIELLPVSWHSKFHSETSTVDRDLSKITLKSVPKLRNFTNNTLVDVLCYSSPTYCQTILTIVAAEMNRLRHLFMSRNPQYDGTISIVGHSLGSMIAFDLISLQDSNSNDNNLVPVADIHAIPRLEFEIGHLFALGSPISLLLTARGHSVLGIDFRLSHCKGFFNIFHPFDPVAYRIEPMLDPQCQIRPVVIPHHKGRKRLHLELKDNLVRVSQDIKTRLFQTLKNTWSSLQEFATAHTGNMSDELADDEMFRVLNKIDNSIGERDDVESTSAEIEIVMGQLNNGKRVDYVLQEAPLESFNDYLFALGSHACYWDSEDTVLMMLKEIYLTLNIYPETRLNESSINAIKPRSRSIPNGKQCPPIIPLVSTHQTVSNTVLPPTFSNIQNKQYFLPNFNSDQSANERNDTTINENEKLEPVIASKISDRQSNFTEDFQHTGTLDPPTGLISQYQAENNFKSNSCFGLHIESKTNDKILETSLSFSEIHNKPPFMPSYQYNDNISNVNVEPPTNETYPVQSENISVKPESVRIQKVVSESKDDMLGQLDDSLYPLPPIMPNKTTTACTPFKASQCYVSSTSHYLLNSSNNVIQRQVLPMSIQNSLPSIPTLSKNTFYPNLSNFDVDFQSNIEYSHNCDQLSVEKDAKISEFQSSNKSIEFVSTAIQSLNVTNYESSPPLIEQFQSIISSNASFSNSSNNPINHFQPSNLNDLSNYFQPLSTCPGNSQSNIDEFPNNYFETINNQSLDVFTPNNSNKTESSKLFETDHSSNYHLCGFTSADNFETVGSVNSSQFQSNVSCSKNNSIMAESLIESQQPSSNSGSLFSESIWKSSGDSKVNNFNSNFPHTSSISDSSKYSILSSKLKSSPEFSNNEYSRTPSPRIFNQNPRNSPKSSVTAPIFSSKPLIPQSGKLFKKK